MLHIRKFSEKENFMRILHLTIVVLLMLYTGSTLAQTTLFHNFTGYTLTGKPGAEAKLVKFNAMLVRQGKITAVGTLTDLQATYGKQFAQNQVDLNGRYVLPGIIDAHGHVLGLGQNLMLADLRDATSEADAVARVAEFAQKNTTANWVLGRGWNQENWNVREFPTAQSLDEIEANRPIYLTRVDGHAAWANSKALELAGITANTVSPDGGEIIRDAQGQPTGVLIDNAMALFEQRIPAQTAEQQKQALELAFEHLLARGITGV